MDAGGLYIYNDQDQQVGGFYPWYTSDGPSPELSIVEPISNTFVSLGYYSSLLRNLSILGDFTINYQAGSKADIWIETQFRSDVYNESGSTVFVSDRRKKRNIKDLVIEKARSFIMALKPRNYKFIKEISKSDRYHHGFIAQEVKEAMTEDWGLYVENKDRDFIGLRYDEITADLVAVVQDQQKRIEALERRVDDLTNNQS
jgi:hypothetical protein